MGGHCIAPFATRLKRQSETHPSQFGGMRRDGGEGRQLWLGDIHYEGGGEEDRGNEDTRDKNEPGVYADPRC